MPRQALFPITNHMLIRLKPHVFSGGFVTAFKLPPGIHTYLYFVDNTEWCTDPDNTMKLSEDGYSQIKICPRLPQHIPLSFQDRPFAHIYLRFDPSTMNCIEDRIRDAGYARNLVSVVVLDAQLASSCALMWPNRIISQALQDLNGFGLTGEHTLEALEFAPTSRSDVTVPERGSSSRVLVGPKFPTFINNQHLMEHFAILVQTLYRIDPLTSQNYSFLVTFTSLESAKAAVSIFNRSLLKGIQITLSYDESHYSQDSLYQHKTLEGTSMHTALSHGGVYSQSGLLPQSLARQSSLGGQAEKQLLTASAVSQSSARQLSLDEQAEKQLLTASAVSQSSAGQLSLGGKLLTASAVSQRSARQLSLGGQAKKKLLTASAESSLPQTLGEQKFRVVHSELQEVSPAPHISAKQNSPLPARNDECKLFVYSKPKFPNFVTNEDLVNHFSSYTPSGAYMIRKNGMSTGIGVVQFPSRSLAQLAITEMEGTTVLDFYSISLKFEDPARPPKQKQRDPKVPKSHSACDLYEKKDNKKNLSHDETEPFFSIKVSNFSRKATKAKLTVLFEKCGELSGDPVIHSLGRNPYAHVNFKSSSAARNALKLNHSQFEGTTITVKPSSKKSQELFEKNTPVPKETTSMVMKLSNSQWNRLMTIGPQGSSLLDDIVTSVDIHPLFKEKSLKFEGEKEAVELFFSYATQHFKKEIIIQRERITALLFLKPSLPAEIMRDYDVKLTGFCKDSCKVEFSGPTSNIDDAYDKVSFLEQSLQDSKVTLDCDFPAEQCDAIQKELVCNEVYLHLPHPDSPTVVLYHFTQLNLKDVVSKIKSLVVSTAKVHCNHKETVFLKHCVAGTKFSAEISFGLETAILKGNFSAVEHTKREVEVILQNLHSHKISITCNPVFESHIRESVLSPFQKLDPSFCYYLDKELDTSTNSAKLDVFVFCNKEQVYSTACKLLEKVQPGTREYNLPDGSDEVVDKMQPKLESEYYVCLEYRKPTLVLHGLMSSNLDQCYAEVKDAIETTVLHTKQISISKHRKFFLSKLYKEELMELERHCSKISFDEDDSITLKGTVKQLEDVKTKLDSKLLTMTVCHEAFIVKHESKFCSMWCNYWELLKQKKSKLLLKYVRNGGSTKSQLVTFEFEVIGTCDSRVKEIKKSILSRSVKRKSFSLSKEGIHSLRKVMSTTGEVDFLNNLVVGIDTITPWGNKVTLCAPESYDNDLDTAVENIRKFAGDDASVTDTISSDNPIVELVLNSSTYCNPYLSAAREMAEHSHVEICVMQGPKPKLLISGPKYSIEVAKSKIQELTIEAIEKKAGKKEIDLKFIYTPIFTMPEFFRLKLQLVEKFCVRCSIPDGNFENEVVSSLTIRPPCSENALEIDIVKGNLLCENVDAIVNAANENLQHAGGLAKAISDAGGPEIKLECDAYIAKHSKLKPGEAFTSKPGCLPYKHVIHAVGPCWSDGKHNEEKILQNAVIRSLELADSTGSISVAIPAIGTGIFNVPIEVCALSTFQAMETFVKDCSITSLQNVRFVLNSQSMVDAFCSRFKVPTTIKKAPVKTKLPTSSYSWKWQNDNLTFTLYDADTTSQLNAAFHSNPSGSCSVTINSSSYTIDFLSMQQTNKVTGFQRKVVKLPATVAAQPKWYYFDKTFHPYSPDSSEAIEAMFRSKKPGHLQINGKVYTFDFDKMKQINTQTHYRRNIKRCFSHSPSLSEVLSKPNRPTEYSFQPRLKEDKEAIAFALPVQGDPKRKACSSRGYKLVLQGLEETLLPAEMALLDKLNSFVSSNVIRPVPDNITGELLERITQIAVQNNVALSLSEDEESPRTLTLQGVTSKVHIAVGDIQEQLHAHVQSQLEKEALLLKARLNQPPDRPPEWEKQPDNGEIFAVFNLTVGSKEWYFVKDKFDETMSGYTVATITRIQNPLLWEKYALSKKHLEDKNGGDANELYLFHGTSSSDPEDIYGGEDGFDMRCSMKGMWGNANYFAAKASYSNIYAHKVTVSHAIDDFPSLLSSRLYPSSGIQRQMFLARVLVGDSVHLPSNSSLTKPPVKSGKIKYDSVYGVTRDSKVYMTYDNTRAYPAYLITYQ